MSGGVTNDGLDGIFGSSIFSAGFDFVEPSIGGPNPTGCNTPVCIDSVFEVILKDGATIVDSFVFEAPDVVAAFIGVWSDTAFDRLEINELVGTDDNEHYGHDYGGDVALAPVPVPAAAWLFGSGVIGLLGIAGRRNRR